MRNIILACTVLFTYSCSDSLSKIDSNYLLEHSRMSLHVDLDKTRLQADTLESNTILGRRFLKSIKAHNRSLVNESDTLLVCIGALRNSSTQTVIVYYEPENGYFEEYTYSQFQDTFFLTTLRTGNLVAGSTFCNPDL